MWITKGTQRPWKAQRATVACAVWGAQPWGLTEERGPRSLQVRGGMDLGSYRWVSAKTKVIPAIPPPPITASIHMKEILQ